MRTSAHIALASIIAVGGIAGAVAVVKRHGVKPPAPTQVAHADPDVTAGPARGTEPLIRPQPASDAGVIAELSATTRPVAAASPAAAAESPKPREPVKPARLPAPDAPAGAAAVPAPPAPRSKPALVAPEARVALSFVGADADAETVWLDAINDPTIPANERKDLIEDLNEDGFADPKNITPDDVPLVVSRIQLIESIAADSMDETNLAAFAEAYKDLVNMLDRATRQ
jgi:hypothetical protein